MCYTLTVGHTGNGSDPTASPTNSTGCNADQYVAGETVTLSGASPSSGWEISGWSGTNNDASTANSNTVTMSASTHAASVTYTEIPPTCYALTVGHTGSGSDPTASPSNSTGCSANQYVAGETISLSGASPDTGWEIDSWSGTDNDSSTASSNTVTMPASTHSASVTYITLSGPETYEDSDSSISYTGNWTSWNTNSASGGSTRYSNDPTASATLTFSGRQISLIFTPYLSRGDIEISIDGGAPVTINQYGSSLSYQHRWYSPELSDGTHSIQLRHPGGSHYIDLDAFEVLAEAIAYNIPPGCNATINPAYDAEVLALVNQERTSRGLSALTLQAQLDTAANNHSVDMACNDFFSRTGSDGSSPSSRATALGYPSTYVGENIYYGSGSYDSPQQAVAAWMASDGHRANILNTNYTQIGVGYVHVNDKGSGYFTTDFGRP